MRATSCCAVHSSAASRISALVAKCHVVDESDTSASLATRRCVTAATPSRAAILTVAATIASRTRLEALARAGDGGHAGIVPVRSYVLVDRGATVTWRWP